MFTEDQDQPRGSLRSVSTDGTHWLFAILADDGWAITRDGEAIAAGTGNRASLDAGIRKFLSLTLAEPHPEGQQPVEQLAAELERRCRSLSELFA